MDSQASYQPWSRVENIDVPVIGLHGEDGTPITAIRVPYVYACDADAVVKTATVVAFETVKALKLARLITEGKPDPGATNQPWLPDAVRDVMQRHWNSLVRFQCPACHDGWDAWPGEDGKLRDVRDVVCSNPECKRFRQMADPQE